MIFTEMDFWELSALMVDLWIVAFIWTLPIYLIMGIFDEGGK